MATFVVLAKWTEKTFASLKDAPKVAEEFKKFIADKGAQIKGWYLLMGQYDEMCILEAPNAETVVKILIPLAAKYGVKTQTLQAFSESEALALIAGMK
ncbi:MAG: GYD domain-containing protein [Deltaproteobacteria bacterium]|nr:GYD domain-containing protein [Deltaproteobacteria bacterium]